MDYIFKIRLHSFNEYFEDTLNTSGKIGERKYF